MAHNINIIRDTRVHLSHHWLIEGTATLAAGTARLYGSVAGQNLYLDPRALFRNPRLDYGLLEQRVRSQPYQLQEFWKHFGDRIGATDLGFLLPIFQAGIEIEWPKVFDPISAFDNLLNTNGIDGYTIPDNINNLGKLWYDFVKTILNHTEDSPGGGFGAANRICTTCSFADSITKNRFGQITDIILDNNGEATIYLELSALSATGLRLQLSNNLTLDQIATGLTFANEDENLQYVLFEQGDFAYIVIINTGLNSSEQPSIDELIVRLPIELTQPTPCQGAACPDARESAGSSWGDPHIFTLDGGFYTFMATGDYILVESTLPNDDFVVQARFRPFEGAAIWNNASIQWSANEATAMNVHGDIVEFYAVDDFTLPLAVINGQEVPLGTATIPLPNGGAVNTSETRASVSWLDGTSVTVELHTAPLGGATLAGRIHVYLPASRWNTVQGLLGNNDGDFRNDIRLRDGTRLPLVPTRGWFDQPAFDMTQELYNGPFRNSWLIRNDESLFSRGVNRFDPFYPSDFISLERLDPQLVATAEAVCSAVGVSSPAVLSRCIMDVANTGDEAFAAFAAAVDPQVPGVAISPRALYLSSVISRELSALVKGVENDAVIWSTTGGTVSVSGQTVSYTPPAEHGTYTITATLAVDPSVSDTVQVVVGTPLALAPSDVLLVAGETQKFTAFGAEGQGVIWSASAGQLSGPGRTVSYTPPADGGTYTVTARLASDSSVVASATVQVVGTALTPSHLNLLPGESVPVTWLNAAPFEPVWSATGGSISGAGESVTYTAPTTTGTYTITATSSDEVLTANATVTVATSFPPIARDINVAGNPNETLDLDPLWNDSDPRNERLTIVAISTPEHGTASILPGGELIRYTPATDYEGVDSFSYTIENERGERASAVIYLTIGFGGYSMQSGGGNAE